MKGLGILTDKPPVLAKCPKHYGIKTRTHPSAWQHDDSEIEIGVDGVPWATDQVRWFVAKGDAIIPGRERTETYDCTFEVSEADFVRKRKQVAPTEVFREIVFVASDADDPPARYSDVKPGTYILFPGPPFP